MKVNPANLSRAAAWGLLLTALLATCKSSNDTGSGDTRTLTVTLSGNGSGTVTGPRDINCPGKCSADYDFESDITLTENPAAGSIFGGWTGDCSAGGTDSLTTFTIDDDPTCDARFDLLGGVATLTVSIEAIGISTGRVIADGIDCGDDAVVVQRSVRGVDCSQAYPVNSTVQVKAGFGNGSYFKGWLDDCGGFATAAEVEILMNGDKNCRAQFDVSGGGIQPKGGFGLDYRAETMTLLENKVIVAGYDAPKGDILDISNVEVITSPAGPEFSPCGATRGAVAFFSPRPQYNGNVFFATCTDNRTASTTPGDGGFTELQILNYAPGKPAHYQNAWVGIADFEFSRLWLTDQSSNTPQQPIQIGLSPGQRSCPFDVTIKAGFAYVAGREGVAGTATENCNNWVGVWKVDLTLNSVVGFTRIGSQLRDVEYGADNKLYVSDFGQNKVHVLNAGTMALERSLTVGGGPVGIKLNDLATRMLVTNWNSNKVQLWNLGNDMLIDEKDSGGIHPVDVELKGNIGVVLNFGDAGAGIGGSVRVFEYTF